MDDARIPTLLGRLYGRSIILVGMMGAGKTSIGRRLAQAINLGFVDADAEIEKAAGMTISEIFSQYGETFFRDREHRVITRLLGEGQRVIATGGGAFMSAATRDRIAERGVSIWLKAEVEVLLRRVRKRGNRPLLHGQDPERTLRQLIDERYPVYGLADFCVVSHDGPHEATIDALFAALSQGLPTLPRLASAAAEAAPNHQALEIAAGSGGDIHERVTVDLGARRYEIVVGKGLIDDVGARIAHLVPGAACAIVTDDNVAKLHLPALETSLTAAGIRHSVSVIEPGEASKSWPVFAKVCDDIIAARMERGDVVVALGGGVVGDLAGFAAATVRRGMGCVQIPTSLLAQVDSSVGGKTAINSVHGKNLVGAFHQPSLVIADTATLATLPPREFRAGYAEVAKYGVIDDAPFFAWLENNADEIFRGGPALAQAIAQSCRSKAAIVARDETEQGDRALLNFGHTFGHALEALMHFDGSRIVHGEGVAIGTACAMRFSVRLGHCAPEDAMRVETHLKSVGLPTRMKDIAGWNIGPEAVLEAMYQDKKVQRGALTFILARGIGAAFVAKGVGAADVTAFLRDELGY